MSLKFNGSIRKFIAGHDSGCFILAGDRGAGKSSSLAIFAEVYKKLGYKVFCQYPYYGTYQIPMIKTNINGIERSNVDKNWLYSANLSDCCILLDEAKNIWPARSWSKWTQADDDFFDFLRHTHTVIVAATLAYDCLDLNVRRAANYSIFITKEFWHLSYWEVAHTTIAKVSDKNYEIIGKAGKQGMRKVSWDVVEIPIENFHFWRKTYYNKYLTEHMIDEKPEPILEKWPKELFLK